jgi:GMP synthase-like glutamine amidotransferase
MRIQVLTHVPFEGPAGIADWAAERGHRLDITKMYQGHEPPGPDNYDFLVVMGGPMGVHDEDQHPWLAKDKKCIERALDTDKYVLGVCLGAQLIAHVLGAPVTRNPHPEIGWFPVRSLPRGGETAFAGFPEFYAAFHWHGDTFGVPRGAVLTAETKACPSQAFTYGDKVAATQFHLETTWTSMEALIENCADEIVSAPFVQDAEAMRRDAEKHLEAMPPLLYRLLDNLTAEEG